MGWAEGINGLMRSAGAAENTSSLYIGAVTSSDPVRITLYDGQIEVSESLGNLKIARHMRKDETVKARGSWDFEPVSDDTRVKEADGWYKTLDNQISAGDTAVLLSGDGQTFYLVGVV